MTNSFKNSLCAGALVLLCLIVFGNTLTHEFVYDDMNIIVGNPHINEFGGNLPHFFDYTYFIISGGEASYRPIPTLSYFLAHRLFGLDPLGYHLISVLLHAINAVLVFMLLGSMQLHRWTALLAACLFAVHPVVTEAVNCVSFNEDLLATLFFLSALLTAIQSRRRTGSASLRLEWLSWGFFACALLSKEMALTLPLVVFLHDMILEPSADNRGMMTDLFATLRRRLRLFLGYLVLLSGYLYLRFFLMVGPAATVTDGVPLLKRVVFIPYQILELLKPAVFPFELSAEYVHAYPKHFWDPVNLVALVLVAGLVASAWWVRKKNAAVTFGVGWLLLTLAPVSNLYELINPMAERYLYLPVIGVVMVTAALAVASPGYLAGRSKWVRQIPLIVLVGLVVGLGVYSVKRNGVWQDNYTLFSETAKKVPGSPRVRGGLGLAYQEMGRLDDAAHEFQRAIDLNPMLVDAHFSLAYVHEQTGRFEAAIAAYERVVKLDPRRQDVHFNLAGLYVKKGRPEDALKAYRRHIEFNPRDVEARNNLGVVYAMLGRLDAAEAEWRGVLAISPNNQNARGNIAKLKAVETGGPPN